jgi:hypothetical protein
MKTKRLLVAAALVVTAVTTAFRETRAAGTEAAPKIQVALLLDTSNSMDGLIAQAKTQLWTVVNEFSKAKKRARTPRLEVALFEYGNNRLSPEVGYVRQVLPFTEDLDKVSENLFSLTTFGGEEYCGKVIFDALARLDWNPSRDVYKVIFIAGNEPFSQGPVDYHESCRSAVSRGIFVNTIFCGADAEGRATGWRDGALISEGRYVSINQQLKVDDPPAPQDREIVTLNNDLNKTYIPYGHAGAESQQRQVAQDKNAAAESTSVIVSRSVTKCNSFYCPSDWDLIDAVKTGKLKLDDLKTDELPAELRPLSPTERKAKIEEASRRRDEIRARVNKLSAEREKFLLSKRPKADETLQSALIQTVREQASTFDFLFEKPLN